MSYLLLLIALLFTQPTQAAECTAYQTSHPSYLLDNAHLSTGKCTSCGLCHINGIYVGTPKTCYACHATGAVGTNVLQRSAAHIPTYAVTCGPQSGGCHNTVAFSPLTNVKMNHTILTAYRCDSCHLPKGQTCRYNSVYNAQCQSNDHPTTGTVNGVKNQPLLGVDCGSSGCHTTTTFNK